MQSQWRGIDSESARTQLAVLNRNLGATEDMIRLQNELLRTDPENFALQLAIASLEVRRDQLQQDLHHLLSYRAEEVVNLSLEGTAFATHGAWFDDLASILRRVQKLFSSVTQAVTSGPTERGPFPSEVVTASRLRLVGTSPGSFRLTIAVESAPDIVGSSVAVLALDSLFALLDATTNREQLLEQTGPLGPRTLSSFRQLVRDLRRADSTANLRWESPTGAIRSWNPEREKLDFLTDALEAIKSERTEDKSANGWLLGASLIRNRFEFQIDGEVLTGRIAAEVRDAVQAHFGKQCAIVYTETKTIDAISQTSSISRTLKSIAPLPQ